MSDFQDILANPPGAQDPIPEMQNLQFGLGQQAMPQPQLQGTEETTRALENLKQMQAQLVAHQKAAEVPSPPSKIAYKTTPDGKRQVDVTLDADSAQIYFQNAQNWQTALGGYAQQMDSIEQQIRAQEAQIRSQPPWVQLATALSANLAQAKDMPGWVQAAGRTSAQLNPRPEELQARRMQVLGSEAQLAERAALIDVGMAREARLASYEKANLSMEQQKLNRLIEKDKFSAEQGVEEKWDDRAVKGFFDPTAYTKELKAANPDIKDEEITALIAGKQSLAVQADTLREKLGKEKFGEFEREQNLKLKNDIKMAGVEHKNRLEEIELKNKGTINPKTGKPFTQFELKEIAELETTGILVQNLENDLARRPELFGPMPQTRAKTWVKSFFDEDVSRIRADYAHALPIMVQLLKEGTRGYAANQRQWVESKVPTTADTPERLRGKLAFMKGFLAARQSGLDKVFVTQEMARDQQAKGQSPYPSPAASHAPAGKQPVQISIDEINKYAK